MSETYCRLLEQQTRAEDNRLDFLDFLAYAIDAVGELDIDKSELADGVCEILEREINFAIKREETK